MDPVAAEVRAIQYRFREFRRSDARVLHVATSVDDTAALEKTLRAEEFHPDNRAPILTFTASYDAGDACLPDMIAHVQKHYGLLREGLGREGIEVAPLGPPDARQPHLYQLAGLLGRWRECTAAALDAPVVCWLPPAVTGVREFRHAVRALVAHTDAAIRFVVADAPERPWLGTSLADAGIGVDAATFRIDESAVQAWFARLMLAEPHRGRAPGAPPGAAAPDVEPPPRPGPVPASPEQVKATLAEHGLPPALSPAEGEALQRLIFGAAKAVGARDPEQAYLLQWEAYDLCARAGVVLEQGMMALVLAGYLVQFQQDEDAVPWFNEAARLTHEAGALPQFSQSLMGLGLVHFKNGRYEDAATVYRAAATAAADAGAGLLVLENLRMAGACFQQIGRTDDAIACWSEAVEVARHTSPGEIATSNFESLCAELTDELRRRGMRRELDHVLTVYELATARQAVEAEAS